MKKYRLLLPVICVILSSCANHGAEGNRMTQAIETESSKNQESESDVSALPSLNEASQEVPSTSLAETEANITASDYYVIKAEIDATKLELEALEARYRIGELEGAAFENQRAELQEQKDTLETQKRERKEPIPKVISLEDMKNREMKELLSLLEEYERKEDELDWEEDRLEASYLAGELTRAQFVEKQADLLCEDDILDGTKDQIEHYLEQLGWDD